MQNRRKQEIKKHPRKLPKKKVFKTVLDRFQKTGSVSIQYPNKDEDKDKVRRAMRDVRPQAELCLKMGGGHFKSQLKKYKRGTI